MSESDSALRSGAVPHFKTSTFDCNGAESIARRLLIAVSGFRPSVVIYPYHDLLYTFNLSSIIPSTDEQTMVKLQVNSALMGTKVELQVSCHRDDDDDNQDGATVENMDPSSSVLHLEKFDQEKINEWRRLRFAYLAKSKTNDIIIPDPTPEWVIDAFYDRLPCLGPILEKDSVQSFLHLFEQKPGMCWDNAVTSQTLTFIIICNALECAKAVLEGKGPELNWKRANPNCINPYGYFPLHEAAEKFSVDVFANVRTVGDDVIGGLLPLHVAIEDTTCLHKYLEDNLLPPTNDDYIYKLIILLCLPEMKTFLDTVRVLAEKTDNLVDEIWNYIKDEKFVHAAVLLLAAQKQVCGDCTSRININGGQSGLHIALQPIVDYSISLGWNDGENGDTHQDQQESVRLNHPASLLVRIILQAGEVLDEYIQGHSEVSHVVHVEVINRVSSILKECGFSPSGEVIDVNNLRPYDCKRLAKELSDKEHVNANNEVTETACLHTQEEKALRKELPKGWDPAYMRRMYIPYWRSVLGAKCRVRVYPSYAPADAPKLAAERLSNLVNSIANGSSVVPNHNIGLLRRTPEISSNHQFKRLFGTAAFTGNTSSRIPNHNLSFLRRIRQPGSSYQSRRLIGTAAFTILKVLKHT